MRKLLYAAAIAGASLGTVFAAPAQATTVMVTDVEMGTPPDIVTLNGGAFNGLVYMGPTTLTFSDNTSALVYCVDILHGVSLGVQSLSYHTDTLANFLGGLGYSSLVQSQIAGLVYAGLNMTYGPNMNPVEGGIWEKLGASVTTGDAALQTQINLYGASNVMYDPTKIMMYVSDDGHQSFAGLSAVPEPASWMLIIGGFGLVGFALRRRAPQTATLPLAA